VYIGALFAISTGIGALNMYTNLQRARLAEYKLLLCQEELIIEKVSTDILTGRDRSTKKVPECHGCDSECRDSDIY
jgi:hypothetical protein